MVREYHTDPNEDLEKPYRLWHRTLSDRCIVTDIDQIEWRMEKGVLVPKAVIELTQIPENANDIYMGKIVERYNTKIQAKAATTVAAALRVQAYNCAFEPDMGRIYLRNLSKGESRWHLGSRWEMAEFIENL